MTPRRSILILPLLGSFALASSSTAQRSPTTSPKPATTGSLVPAEFSDQIVKVEGVGLSVQLPLHSSVEKLTVNLQSATRILADDQSWSVLIRTPRVSKPTITVRSLIEEVEKSLLLSVGVVDQDDNADAPRVSPQAPETKFKYTRARVLERSSAEGAKPLFLQNGQERLPLERVYVAIPQGADNPAAIRAVSVAQVAQQQFVIFELTTTDKEFDRVRPIYEAVVASSRFADTAELNAARGLAIEAGLKLLQGLEESDYRELLAKPERWIRMYRPAPTNAATDADEVGYSRIRAFVGQRGLMDDRPKAQWSLADREEGYVIQIDSRAITAGQLYDTKAVYFLAPTRDSEAWAVRSAGREIPAPGKTKSKSPAALATEIGARSGKNLTVTTSATGRGQEETRPQIQSDAYVSRVDAMLLPQFILRHKSAADYAFYVWQSGVGKIQLRRDSLTPPPEPGGVWTLSTRHADADRPQVSLYSDAGDLIRTEMPDGIICEPTTKERLADLWRSKGLPMD